MNRWLKASIEYANNRAYLDDLFRVYPIVENEAREIDAELWRSVEVSFQRRSNQELLKTLLKLSLFPIKDSYVAFLRRDLAAIERNPQTVNRICGRLYHIGLDSLYERCSSPKEANRQIGISFKHWIGSGSLGIIPVGLDQFTNCRDNAILKASDNELKEFAQNYLGYTDIKGLDLIARFNGKYVIAEAKFITDFGGHQNAQFNDAIKILTAASFENVIKVAVLDGVCYLSGNNAMYRRISNDFRTKLIMSSLVLRDFLYSL